MSVLEKRLEIAVNISILCAFVMVAALAGQRLWRAHAANGISQPEVGAKISLSGMEWSKSSRTLILALSTGCHYCSESADFYKKLVPEANAHGVRVIAVLPQTTTEAHAYLDGLGVHVEDVVQKPLSAVDAAATPTLLVVDSGGKISKAWVGKLPPEVEGQVIASLQ